MKLNDLKKKVCDMIDENYDKLFSFAEDIYKHPELGFKEKRTAEKVCEFFDEIGINYINKLALTGVKGSLNSKNKGPNVCILGELDGIICHDSPDADKKTGATHTCGHNLQITAMLAAAIGLKKSGVYEELSGNISFMAVPAEEFIELEYREKLRREEKISFLSGKQELIYQGAFDDVDIAMMIHSLKNAPKPTVALGSSSNGFVGKTIEYIGKTAHAAEAPHTGINALNAATLGIMGINALRETFRDEDSIRVHPIITKGGDSVNSVPAHVKMESYVRANNVTAIKETNEKVDRALIAGAYAVGAEIRINTIPGHLPLRCSEGLNDLFRKNSLQFLSEESVIDAGHFAASTDMGDISNLIPSIHPFIGGVSGALHTKEFKVEDFYAACILPGKIMAMTVIDLLFKNAEKANEIIENYKPTFDNKDEYLKFLKGCFDRKVNK